MPAITAGGMGGGRWAGFCVRYFTSTAGGVKDAALVFFDGDIASSKNEADTSSGCNQSDGRKGHAHAGLVPSL